MNKPFFKSEDFAHFYGAGPAEIATVANRKLEMEIEKWPVVYDNITDMGSAGWAYDSDITATQKARLAFIEQIEKKEE